MNDSTPLRESHQPFAHDLTLGAKAASSDDAANTESTRYAAHVLVVDDEEHVTEFVAMGLRFNGFDVERASSGRGALDAIENQRPDLIVLDVTLPDIDGFDVARRLRQNESPGTRIPIIFLTTCDTMTNEVDDLCLGTDDCVAKPFNIEEVIERAKAMLRRSKRDSAGERRLTYSDLVLDEGTRDVWRAGKLIELTPTEYKLLHYLLSNARSVLTRDQILENVWGYAFAGDGSVLETYVRYLRQKVDAIEPPLIQTIRGVGYSLRGAPERRTGTEPDDRG